MSAKEVALRSDQSSPRTARAAESSTCVPRSKESCSSTIPACAPRTSQVPCPASGSWPALGESGEGEKRSRVNVIPALAEKRSVNS
ncbi:MAG: hypothetical protein E6J88_10810 [Deltaproteobacteria bacterium]|nr:MAG: hypothetical protein E6J88_10810 [Deltaproteobacteria bacterium]